MLAFGENYWAGIFPKAQSTSISLPKWARDKALSFVPPDGRFVLMEYRLVSAGTTTAPALTLPFSLRSSVELLEGSANVDLVFQPRPGSSKGQEGILVEWYLGKDITTSSWIPSGGGSTSNFDVRTGVRPLFA
jgi:AP-3 complex subunit mu